MIKESQDKILPYVYKLTHKETNQFYIGSRTTKYLKLTSNLDIIKYKSSSKYVKELGFENFNVEIIAEFFDPKDAYDFEQELIFKNIEDPLCLNKVCHHKDIKKFNVIGTTKIFSENHKRNLSLAKIGKNNPMFGVFNPCSEDRKLNISKSLVGKFKKENNPMFGKSHSIETKEKISRINKGKTRSSEWKMNRSLQYSGENNPNAKISESEKIKIYNLFISGMSRKDIHSLYVENCSYKTICQVVSRLTSKLLKLSSSDI